MEFGLTVAWCRFMVFVEALRAAAGPRTSCGAAAQPADASAESGRPNQIDAWRDSLQFS